MSALKHLQKLPRNHDATIINHKYLADHGFSFAACRWTATKVAPIRKLTVTFSPISCSPSADLRRISGQQRTSIRLTERNAGSLRRTIKAASERHPSTNRASRIYKSSDATLSAYIRDMDRSQQHHSSIRSLQHPRPADLRALSVDLCARAWTLCIGMARVWQREALTRLDWTTDSCERVTGVDGIAMERVRTVIDDSFEILFRAADRITCLHYLEVNFPRGWYSYGFAILCF